ncbi:MAG: cytochrome c oxidase assembly protein [Terricaulis sp.]
MSLTPEKRKRMAITAAVVSAIVVGMTGMAFAAVPLYSLFCQVTGYGGTTQTASAAATTILDRRIEVRFDANTATGVPIEFEPAAVSQSLRLGETGLAFYRVRNLSDQPVTVVASYNVTPHKIGKYFEKLECFCFQDQTLAPGQSAELPVVYFVDPALASDPDTEEVNTVTLSYTFFRSQYEAVAALEAQAQP